MVGIAILGFDVPRPVNFYATSNNNNENASSLLSSATSDGQEHRSDANQSLSSQFPFIPPSNGDSNNGSQPGALLVTKQVINEGGGEAEPSDFTITVDGNNPTPSSFDGSSSGTSVTLKPGSYSVNENSLLEYTSSKSSECAGSLSAGQTKQCTISNIYQPIDKSAQLIVINSVIDNNNDYSSSELTVKPSAFIITVHGNDPLPRSFPGKSEEGVIVNLNPGRYSVTADGPDRYSSDYSDGCKGTIRAGDAKVCIITNEDITPPSPIPPQPPQPVPPTAICSRCRLHFCAQLSGCSFGGLPRQFLP